MNDYISRKEAIEIIKPMHFRIFSRENDLLLVSGIFPTEHVFLEYDNECIYLLRHKTDKLNPP